MKSYNIQNITITISYNDDIILFDVFDKKYDISFIFNVTKSDFIEYIGKNLIDTYEDNVLLSIVVEEEADGKLVEVIEPVTLRDYLYNYITNYDLIHIIESYINYFHTNLITNKH